MTAPCAGAPAFPLAIVTSCTGYGQYLADWAGSLLGLTRRPAEIGLFTHGSEADRLAGAAAAARLRGAGFLVHLVHEVERCDLGTARNRAVGLTTAEWVMHLDADDMLMPHAVDDIAALAPGADVVSLGYERCGDRPAGPRQTVKTYRSGTGGDMLVNPTPASGNSPFRRRFWELAPYRTDLRGGWDTALWLGFAHQGARFRPTRRPGFWYRQHGDSLFNTRRGSGWPAERAGQQLAGLRRGDHGVSILVPFAPDESGRAAAWDWVRRRYRALYPDWELVEGASRRGLWNKGEAVAAALARAHGAVLVLADADCLVPAAVLREAVALVQAGAAWVVPHRRVHRLNAAQTADRLAADPGGPWAPAPASGLARPAYNGLAGGGVVVVGRADYEACGGIPRGFDGWGGEDEALAVMLDTLAGPHRRLEADLIHLWHTPSATRRSQGGNRNNRPLLNRYVAARGRPDLMWALCRPDLPPPRAGGAGDAAVRYATRAARQEETRALIARAVAVSSIRGPTMSEAERRTRRAAHAAAFQESERARAETRAIRRAAFLARDVRSAKMSRAPFEDKMVRPAEDKAPRGVHITDQRRPDPPEQGHDLDAFDAKLSAEGGR